MHGRIRHRYFSGAIDLYPGIHRQKSPVSTIAIIIFTQIEHVFVCEIINDSQLGNGHETDKKQIGYRWIKLNELSEYKVLPSPIKSLLQTDDLALSNSYLGDVN